MAGRLQSFEETRRPFRNYAGRTDSFNWCGEAPANDVNAIDSRIRLSILQLALTD